MLRILKLMHRAMLLVPIKGSGSILVMPIIKIALFDMQWEAQAKTGCWSNNAEAGWAQDEIGTEAEALAARSIAQRGVQLVATAHGAELARLIKNPTLSDLIGGIQACAPHSPPSAPHLCVSWRAGLPT